MGEITVQKGWNLITLKDGDYINLPVAHTPYFEIYCVAAGAGGGGNGHTFFSTVQRTGWGGGGSSGGYGHYVRHTSAISATSGYYYIRVVKDGGDAGGGGQGHNADNGAAYGEKGVDGEGIEINITTPGISGVETLSVGGGISSYVTGDETVTNGGSSCSTLWDNWTHHGDAMPGGAGMEIIDGTTSADYGTGGSSTGGSDGTPGSGGAISLGETKFSINKAYSIKLSDYGAGGAGAPDNEGTQTGVPGTAGCVQLLYYVNGPYSASVSVAQGLGTAAVSKTSDISYGEVITFTASPSSKYVFSKWSDSNTSATHTVTVTGDISLSAYFIDLNESTILLTIDSGGGTFDINQNINNVVVPEGISSGWSYSYTADRLIWAYNANESQLEVKVTINLTSLLTNFIRPAGMNGSNSIYAYELQVPYQVIYSEQGVTSNNQIKFKRKTQDNICHYVMYPRWVPTRDQDQRCVITMPNQPALDFGNIQSISETYSASLSTIPVVCKGYTGSFCMDLGVSKKITVNYIRVSPVSPDNTDIDSRKWSNAYWIGKLKEYTDRWQMRTNGCLLYIVRPEKARLKDGSETDPMVGYYTEVLGENAYITSAPVKYDTTSPHMINNSVSFTIGTLYPKASPVPMCQVIYHAYNSGESQYTLGNDISLYYPKDTSFALPECFSGWPIKCTDDGNWLLWTSWRYYNSSGEYTDYNPGDVVSFGNSDTIHVYSNIQRISSVSKVEITSAITKTYTVTKTGNVAKIYLIVCGGGGGGGATLQGGWGSVTTYPVYLGGGGGSSGAMVMRNYSLEASSCSIKATCGAGGLYGTLDTLGEGSPGKASYVYIDGALMVYAKGGNGGKTATASISETSHKKYEGGAGGAAVSTNSFAGGRGGSFEWAYHGGVSLYENGQEGEQLSGYTANHISGYGSTRSYYYSSPNTYEYYTGGGGGGAPSIVEPGESTYSNYVGGQTSLAITPEGVSQSARVPSHGGGGAGRSKTHDVPTTDAECTGAAGYIYILVSGGSISEN